MAKRLTKTPDRYGKRTANMDGMFDDIDKSTSNGKESTFVQSDDELLSDTSNSAPEKNLFKENGSQNALQRQMARVEVKLNEIFAIVMQIHRAHISDVVSTQIESENVPELPLKSDESLNKFELDLAQGSYRAKIVSNKI